MKKLVALAGLIALGLAGVAEAARPAGAGKPGGGSPTPSVTYVESPLVEVGVEDGVKVWSEVAGSSVRISSLGHWVVETTIGGETYDVCLDAELPPANVNTPLLLESNVAAGVGGFSADGDIGVSNQGYWLGPTFQIYPGGTSCIGDPIQQSGIHLDTEGSGLSQFSSPLVDSVCAAGIDPSAGDCDVESTVLINNRGDWYLATKGLERRTEYDICLDGVLVLNGASKLTPIFLSDKKSTAHGYFYANGNAADPGRGGAGTWQEMSFLVKKEKITDLNCLDDVVLETGIGITIAP